jgi:peptidoglycan/xylan/chitin deacetylase (PgdA/CDA1 family)
MGSSVIASPQRETTVILNYHRLYDRDPGSAASPMERFYAVERNNFREHLAFLKQTGISTLMLDEFLNAPSLGDSQNLVITFDDGSDSDLNLAVPILRAFGFRAVFFICAEYIGKPGHLSPEGIRGLRDSGMSVQSHGLFHHDLTKLSYEKAIEELKVARLTLEEIVGSDVSYLAVPGGFINEQVYSAALAAGYKAVCTSFPGLAYQDRQLNRIAIRHSTTQRQFEAYACRKRIPIIANSLRYRGARHLKRFVGIEHYEAIKLKVCQQKSKSSVPRVNGEC